MNIDAEVRTEKVEMSAATISALKNMIRDTMQKEMRSMIREEIKTGNKAMEEIVTRKVDEAVKPLQRDLDQQKERINNLEALFNRRKRLRHSQTRWTSR